VCFFRRYGSSRRVWMYPHELGVLNMDELIQHCQGRCTNFIYAAGDQADKGPRFERRITAPVFLLRWLVRLVTPKGGVVLDPFASTAATAEAALLEGCSSISIAPDVKYLSDIRQHILLLGSGD